MEYCSSCRRRFASGDIFRRHAPRGKCPSPAALRTRGIFLKDGVWHRPNIPQMFPARKPGRPKTPTTAISSVSERGDKAEGDGQHQGTGSGAEAAS